MNKLARKLIVTRNWQSGFRDEMLGCGARAKQTFGGLDFKLNMESALAASEEERQREFEKRWAYGGLPFIGAFGDLLYNQAANDLAAEFVRRRSARSCTARRSRSCSRQAT